MVRLTLLAFIVLAFSASTSERVSADDLDSLQGKWESFATRGDKTFHIVKTIRDQTETVEQYLGDELIHRHEVEFTLDESGPVKIFRYENGRITHGSNAGRAMPDGAFAYRLIDDTWVAVFGLLEDDEENVSWFRYRRMADE